MNLTENFAQECCKVDDLLIALYAPDSGKVMEFGFGNLVDMEIRTGISLVRDGFIVLEDPYDIASLVDTNKNLWIYVFYAENKGENSFKCDFRVLNIERNSTNNKSLIRFNLQDSLSYIFSKSYKASYQLSLMQSLQEFYNEFYIGDKNWIPPVIAGISNFRNLYTIDAKGDSTEPFNIPVEDFLSAYSKQLDKEGFICINENNVLRLCKAENLNALQSSTIPIYKRFSQSASNSPNYLYYSKFSEAPVSANAPKSNHYSIDFETKKIKIQSQNLEDIGESKENQDSNGFNLSYSETGNISNIYKSTYFDFLNNYSGYIVIPGRKANIRILNQISLEVYNPSNNSKISKSGDLKYSGKYIVTGYTNKIVNRNKLVTCARVCRFDSTKS